MESVGLKPTEFYKVEDGEWFEVDVENFQHKCCDCGLVHNVKFKFEHKDPYDWDKVSVYMMFERHKTKTKEK